MSSSADRTQKGVQYAPGSTPAFNKRYGLHDRLNRISHFDFNVSDLERSREWYEKFTALKVVGKTLGDQAFPSLGIERGRFEGYLLQDPTQLPGMPMIHLVEWKDPKPVGKPYFVQGHVGWYRLVGMVSDMKKLRDDLAAEGYKPFFEATDYELKLHPEAPHIKYNMFCLHDPDGITLEFLEGPKPLIPVAVPHNTTNFEKHLPFFTEILGLDFLQGLQTKVPHINVYSPVGGMTQWDGGFFGMRGDKRVIFDWLQWAKEHSDPTPYPAPNSLGIIRCVFEVDDLDESYQILQRIQQERDINLGLSPPETWDFGLGLHGRRRVLEFMDGEGVRFQLIEALPSPYAQVHPYGFDPFASTRET